jgi:hypothetical protein
MNEEKIFHRARARRDPEERAAYLEQACGGDAALRASIEALLRADVGASGFMDRPTPDPQATLDAPIVERPGTVIGPYRLLQEIGEGGMGTVFMAEQVQPVRRTVALKVISPGMDSRQVIARFEAERQALALMDHPNIARVLDAGTAPDGRPYFVMELVKGVPITRYCDEHRLTPRERLELFVPVCQAVQHAHQKGISPFYTGIANLWMGEALSKEKDWEAAIAALREAIRLLPERRAQIYLPSAYLALGTALAGAGLHAEAREGFLAALHQNPTLGQDPQYYFRYNAACFAMNCADGKGMSTPAPAERTAYRKQALELLTAEPNRFRARQRRKRDRAGVASIGIASA